MVHTLLKNSSPVHFDDCLVGIFVLLTVTHGDVALSSKLRLYVKPTDFFTIVGAQRFEVRHRARSASDPSAYVFSTFSNCYSLGCSEERVEVIE